MRPIRPPEEILEIAATGKVGVKTVPEREVAYAVHRGPHTELQNAFLRLMKWISENGYELMGPGEAVFHVDPVVARSEEDLITEIRFPVKKK